MAVTIDQASLAPTAGSTGTGSAGSPQQNHTFATSADVAAGAVIVILVFRFRTGATGTVTGTGGSLTWVDLATPVTGTNIAIHLVGAIAPSGLASGTSIGVTNTVNSNDYTVTAASYLGVDTSGGLAAAIRGSNGSSAGTAAWSTGALGATAGDALIGGAGGDGTLRTSTPGGDAVERNDYNSGTTSGSVTLIDDLDADGSSDTIDGTWSGTLTHLAIGAALIPAAGGGAAAQDINTPRFQAIPFMGGR